MNHELRELKFSADCQKFHLAMLPAEQTPEAHGYFRELTGEISCVVPLPVEIWGLSELGLLLSPSRAKLPDAPDSSASPAIIVQIFLLYSPRMLLPGHSTLLPDGDHIGLDTAVPEPLLSLHKWSASIAEQVLFALDREEESNLILSPISSQPPG